MKLLKTKKINTLHSVCGGMYDYKDKETHYIVDLTEREFIVCACHYLLKQDERDKLLKALNNPNKPTKELKDLFKEN